jgi:hypothetical protein
MAAVNPGENTQSHADFRFALRRIGEAIKCGRKPDLAEIADRIDRFRNQLYAQGQGKQKLPSRGETYGERTARRAYERYAQSSNLSPDAATVIKDYIAKHRLSPNETLTVTFNNSQGDAIERTATAGRALSSEFAHTIEMMKKGGYTFAAVDRAVHAEKHKKDRVQAQAMELSQVIGE